MSELEISQLLSESGRSEVVHNWHRKDNGQFISGYLKRDLSQPKIMFQIIIYGSTRCPSCSEQLYRNKDGVYCGSCCFAINRRVASRTLTEDEFLELLRYCSVGPLGGFISKDKKEFSAMLKLHPKESKVVFDFNKQCF